MSRSALVLGATGLVGGRLLAHLSRQQAWGAITLLGRRHPPLPDGRFSAIEADLAALDAHAGAFAVDDVFCCLGTTLRKAGSKQAFRRVDHDFCLEVARQAAAAGARRLIMVSAVNANPSGFGFYARVKGETERDVAALGLPLVVFMQPSLLRGDRQETRVAEQLGEKVLSVVTPALNWTRASWLPIDADTVAAAMVGVALQGPEQGVIRLRYGDMQDFAQRIDRTEQE